MTDVTTEVELAIRLSQAIEIIRELLDEVSACDPYSYHNDKASPIRQRAREFVEKNK